LKSNGELGVPMNESISFVQEGSMKLDANTIGHRKIFVLDTNVLIHNPQALFSFDNNVVIIPIIVIEEIDNFKKNLDEKGRNARQIGRYLDQLRTSGSLKDGVFLQNNGFILVSVNKAIENETKDIFSLNLNDNYIIGTAVYFTKQFPANKVILISKDANVRIKADAIGLNAENYEDKTVVLDELYSGIRAITVSEEIWEDYSINKIITVSHFMNQEELFPQQFVRIFKTQDFTREYLVGRYSAEQQSIYPLKNYIKNTEIFGIKARNEEQEFALELLLDPKVKMVTLIGKAGTGKTLLAIASGLHQVWTKGVYKRLVVSRPISPMGKDIGFLPGSKADKFNPWMQPIYDNMEVLLHLQENKPEQRNTSKKGNKINEFLDMGLIELEPLTYIRGRSLPKQFMIIDEAQNLTPHEVKTIITRAGEGTKIVFTGDPHQIDTPYLDSLSNGLTMSAEKMKSESMVGHITLEKGERSKLSDLAAKYFG